VVTRQAAGGRLLSYATAAAYTILLRRSPTLQSVSMCVHAWNKPELAGRVVRHSGELQPLLVAI